MSEENPNEFWRQAEGAWLILRVGNSPGRYIYIEELYRQFKARLMAELLADVPGTQTYGLLVDRAAAPSMKD